MQRHNAPQRVLLEILQGCVLPSEALAAGAVVVPDLDPLVLREERREE